MADLNILPYGIGFTLSAEMQMLLDNDCNNLLAIAEEICARKRNPGERSNYAKFEGVSLEDLCNNGIEILSRIKE